MARSIFILIVTFDDFGLLECIFWNLIFGWFNDFVSCWGFLGILMFSLFLFLLLSAFLSWCQGSFQRIFWFCGCLLRIWTVSWRYCLEETLPSCDPWGMSSSFWWSGLLNWFFLASCYWSHFVDWCSCLDWSLGFFAWRKSSSRPIFRWTFSNCKFCRKNLSCNSPCFSGLKESCLNGHSKMFLSGRSFLSCEFC